MSQHQFFSRAAVPQQVAIKQETVTFSAPVRGLILSENESYMQPGAALICDNWKPTMKGAALRGGFAQWAQLPETTPVISSFQYINAGLQKMFFANATKLYDVSTSTPTLVKGGQLDGNYTAAQFANQGGDFLLAVNDAGDPVLRFDGTNWTTLNHTTPINWAISTAYVVGDRRKDSADNSIWKCTVAHTSPGSGTFAADRTANARWAPDSASDGNSWITGPVGTPIEHGSNLVHVCKYRNRLFFIERNSMNAWYLGINAIGGALNMIPLSGAATKGGKLMYCATWSLDAGDGTDDKIVFGTDLGEIIVFTGSNPSDAANWRQEGRFDMSPPMGKNATLQIGGDLLVACVDGILPTSGAVTKSRAELELAAITRNIKPMWREEVLGKRNWAWTMCKWDIYGGIFVTWPGGKPGEQRCAVVNAATGAWARFTGWDCTCFAKLNDSMFFGTQTGAIMEADRTGFDNGMPYTCTLVGGWEVFQSPSQTITWKQARASFTARTGETFQPQLGGTTDYAIVLPSPPSAAPDPGPRDVWDQGLWDQALWDASSLGIPVVRNTGWVSIGVTGFSHAPVVQVTVGQQAKPEVELISIAATFERLGITV